MNKVITHLCMAFVLPIFLTSCFKTREEIAREKEERDSRSNIQQNLAEYNQSFDHMQVEVGKMQGRFEELEFQRKKDISAINSSRENTEKNVADLRGKLDNLQKGQETLFEEMRKLKEDNLQLMKLVSERMHAAPATAPNSQKKNSTTSSNSFESALNAYKTKECDAAIEGFRGYLEANARPKKMIDAHYYIGDCLYRQKNYAEAIVEFAVVHEKSLKSAWGRKSTLKIAESFKALGKEKDARAFAQILIDSSPGSEEAKKAKRFIK